MLKCVWVPIGAYVFEYMVLDLFTYVRVEGKEDSQVFAIPRVFTQIHMCVKDWDIRLQWAILLVLLSLKKFCNQM